MTAIVRTFTPQGFALVADGRCSNSEDGSVISDEVQKIFPVRYAGGVFALSFAGGERLTSIDTGEQLNLPESAMRCVQSLESRRTSNAVGYSYRLSRCINDAIKGLGLGGPIHSGKSTQPNLPDETGETIFRLLLDGYESNAKPVAIDMRFYHVGGQLRDPEVKPQPLLRGFHRAYAPCPIIGEILWGPKDDQRLSAYQGPRKFVEEITLQDAIDRSKTYILAHGDPEAIALDGDCRCVGGHIHVATITPDDGFQWVIPPKNS